MTDSIAVTITVTDIDEPGNDPPLFTEESRPKRFVAENTASGQNIGATFTVTDSDSEDVLTYSLDGTDASSFSIVRTTGQLQTKAPLDYETKRYYYVTVSVSDGNGGSDSINVTIYVQNVNEAPTFTEGSSTTRLVAENTASGENIGAPVAATDVDSNVLTYTLSGTDAASFSIVSTSGQLQTKAALNYETKTSYSVTVSASDIYGSSDNIAVTITVTDVSNEVTNFTEGSSTPRLVAEHTASGENIGTPVTATGNVLTYTLDGTDVAAFSIVSTTGQLQTKAALDYETKSSYSVTVSVSDSNGGSDSIAVTIDITDINEVPIFTESSTTRSVAENTPLTQTSVRLLWQPIRIMAHSPIVWVARMRARLFCGGHRDNCEHMPPWTMKLSHPTLCRSLSPMAMVTVITLMSRSRSLM